MDLDVEYEKVGDVDEAWIAVKANITPELMARFKVKADITYKESSKEIVAKGKGFELSINLLDDKAIGKIKLSLLLRPLKSKIIQGIEKQLKRVV